MRPIATLLFAALALVSQTARAAPVIVDGLAWRQLTDTDGILWADVATVCPSGGGLCSGSVGGVSFSGWTWATRAEVGTLLFAATTGHPGGVFNHEQAGNAFDTALGGFGLTSNISGVGTVAGRTADVVAISNVGVAFIQHFPSSTIGEFTRLWSNLSGVPESTLGGIWLYRAVPLPGALPMALAGLGALGWVGRRRQGRGGIGGGKHP